MDEIAEGSDGLKPDGTTAQMGPDWTEEMEAIATKRPIFTVYEGSCYWSMPDGSNMCITGSDAKMINDALKATGAFVRRGK